MRPPSKGGAAVPTRGERPSSSRGGTAVLTGGGTAVLTVGDRRLDAGDRLPDGEGFRRLPPCKIRFSDRA